MNRIWPAEPIVHHEANTKGGRDLVEQSPGALRDSGLMTESGSEQLRVYRRRVSVSLSTTGGGNPGRLGSRRRHFPPDRRRATDARQHDGMIQALPPSLRPKSPCFDSTRIRFDDG